MGELPGLTATVSMPLLCNTFNIFDYKFSFLTSSALAQQVITRLYAPFVNADAAPHAVFRLERQMKEREGCWQVSVDEEVIENCPSQGVALQLLEYAVSLRVIEHRADLIALHGATVFTPSGTLFIAGESGAGKTTLALALGARGYCVGGDDVAFLDPDTNTLMPLPRCFHVDRRSRRLLKQEGLQLPIVASRSGFVTAADVTAPPTPAPSVRHLVYLIPGRRGFPSLAPMPQAEMVARLQAEAGWGGLSTEVSFAALGQLVSSSGCWSMQRGNVPMMTAMLATLP